MSRSIASACLGALLLLTVIPCQPSAAVEPTSAEVRAALRRAAEYYDQHVSLRGGYVYYYSPDLQKRLGEGVASDTQIWVQPPGTPTVGLALLAALQATGDPFFLQAAHSAGRALYYGQLESGGWTNKIDFDPASDQAAQYRNGRGKGRNYSTLDDGATQAAVRFLARLDQALGLADPDVHECATVGLNSLLQAQFPNGAFPQVWSGPVSGPPPRRARFPDYDWRTEYRIKEYWNLYTLNDDLAGDTAAALITAFDVYGDTRYREALLRLGEFLLIAQMPEPQPAWAQQYSYDMYPAWARAFEPPAIASSESQDVLETLLRIYEETGHSRFLVPVPRALQYLRQSQLADGRLARYYELQSNRPLYMQRRGDAYTLTHSDADLPSHYGWKIEPRLDEIERQYQRLRDTSGETQTQSADPQTAAAARRVIESLDSQGRWISTYDGQRLPGQPKFQAGEKFLSSAVFAENVELLSDYLQQLEGR